MRVPTTRIVLTALLLACCATLQAGSRFEQERGLASDADVRSNGRPGHACSQTTKDAYRACRHEVSDDFWIEVGKCRNLSDVDERGECRDEAEDSLDEERELCGEQMDVRDDICDAIGEDPYDPEIDPADFTAQIDNPLLPYIVGNSWTYEGETDEGLETIVVEVLDETRDVAGVECAVVRDRVYLDGELIEDTLDWYAQDSAGNVWYFGEISYEVEDDVIVSLEGSWETGVDGAKPGIVMFANPVLGQTYRQEFLLGEAEDMGRIEGLNQAVDIDFGSFGNAVQTRDFLPIEPDALEYKYFVPGIGFVLEVKPETGEQVELIDMTIN